MTKVLIALSSHSELGDTGRKTGFYVPEAAHPYEVFTTAGFTVDYVSVRGGHPPRDGVKEDDTFVADFLDAQSERLATTPSPEVVDPAQYDAIFFAGGHGTMWDFPDAKELTGLAAAIYEKGGVVAGVCHGPAALVNLQLSDGSYLVEGKQISAFTDEEEAAVGLTETVPFLLESALRERGANISKAENFAEHAVADQRVVTGQNPASARRVAELVRDRL